MDKEKWEEEWEGAYDIEGNELRKIKLVICATIVATILFGSVFSWILLCIIRM